MNRSVDCIYVAAVPRDARLVRTCLASIRHFHPDVPIRLLAGAPMPRRLIGEWRRACGVVPAAIAPGHYGWGFVKLEPLFGPPGERFLVLDSDTVLTGPVLDLWNDDSDFVVDDETLPEADSKRLYYDWERLSASDPAVVPAHRAFNSGQWFGTAGLVRREAFDPWLEWSMPRRARHPQFFMGGEQGVLNYVLLGMEARGEIRIARRTLLRWPGHSMAGLSAEAVARGAAPALVVHWAGMKKMRLGAMVGGDLLRHFERRYYERMPAGRPRRFVDILVHFVTHCRDFVAVRVRLGWRKRVLARRAMRQPVILRKKQGASHGAIES